MSLAAEVQWAALPPLTFAGAGVVVSAALEPCYDIGGDSFDYAVNGEVLHTILVDAVGHGVAAARLAVFAVDVYRNARRSGLSIGDTALSIDRWVAEQFPGEFATGVILELNTRTGQLDYVVAGHPTPVLFRDQRPVGALEGPNRYPFGLGYLGPGTTSSMGLENGDRLLLFSDGIVEARREGVEFGTERLLDFFGRQLDAHLAAPETLRRLIHQVLDYQEDELADDATAVLVEWSTDALDRLLL
jgi:serine phosphatase RsbU (regulator of sigma subunit)